MATKTRLEHDQSVERLFAREAAALADAEALAARGDASKADLLAQLGELSRHYRGLLRQTIKVTRISDGAQLQLRKTTRELAEAVEKVENLNSELRGLQQEKDEIFAMAVHDLRSPLSGICGLATMMQDPAMSAEAELRVMAGDISGLGNNLLAMISDLVDLYRFESGGMAFNPEAATVKMLADTMTTALTPAARRKYIKLWIKTGGMIEQEFPIDLEQFHRIAGNLVSNAVKYSPASTTVTVRLELHHGTLYLSVRDSGPGIGKADQAKLFKKFARLTARPTAGETSSGLGLAIVRRLVQNLSGDVWCESELGVGATFYVTLPVLGKK
ncbi:MAG TPA: HAMP domain-containing sensor histidine kinase [Rariglobus sp.]